jgi:NCS1 family nucleobase:cation symporter-1
VNWKAILALVAGSAVAFVGLVYAPLRALYDYAWFVGFGVSFTVYWALTAGKSSVSN